MLQYASIRQALDAWVKKGSGDKFCGVIIIEINVSVRNNVHKW